MSAANGLISDCRSCTVCGGGSIFVVFHDGGARDDRGRCLARSLGPLVAAFLVLQNVALVGLIRRAAGRPASGGSPVVVVVGNTHGAHGSVGALLYFVISLVVGFIPIVSIVAPLLVTYPLLAGLFYMGVVAADGARGGGQPVEFEYVKFH